jgi:hypothetical protein
MEKLFVQFADEGELAVVSVFAGPQDPDDYPNQGLVQVDDARYLAFINPAPDFLALNTAKLLDLTQIAAAQKAALSDRVDTLSDAVARKIATAGEIDELPVRSEQLINWKNYAVFLGRVSTQPDWPHEPTWPEQPSVYVNTSPNH